MTTTLVLGGAVSGAAAAGLALRLGHDVRLYDRNVDLIPDLPGDVDVVLGAWDRALLDGVDRVVASPGVPLTADPMIDALAGHAPVISELEFGTTHLSCPYVAVTGTNGKTTVTEASAAMMMAEGLRACAAGNVGLAVSDIALDQWDVIAIEASSFQLERTVGFHPRAAAILNIAPDHLDWHGGFDAYADAKLKITANQTENDVFVFDPDDEVTSARSRSTAARKVPVSGSKRPVGGNGPDADGLWIGTQVFPCPDLDAMWVYDLAVAATLADAAGVGRLGILHVLETFRPGMHRRTIIGTADGVTWVNDSKATNPHAAVAAVSAYPSVVLIAGGRNKGLDLSPIVAAETVRHVLALGEAAEELVAAGGPKVTLVSDLEAAVDRAAQLAEPGDTVLLAPGCASFDMFDSYGHRGDVFTHLVTERILERDTP